MNFTVYHDITFPGNLSTFFLGNRNRPGQVPWHYISGQSLHAPTMPSASRKVPWHYISGQSLHAWNKGGTPIVNGTMTLHFRAISPPGSKNERSLLRYHDITFPGNLSTPTCGFIVAANSTMTLHFRAISPRKLCWSTKKCSVPWHYISGQSLHFFYEFKDDVVGTMTLHFRAISPPLILVARASWL